MPTEIAHWRIAYPNDVVYNIFGATNISDHVDTVNTLNSRCCKRFRLTKNGIKSFHFWQRVKTVTQPNGLASYFGDEKLGFKHVFVEGGTCTDAMNKLVELLDKRQSPLHHDVPIIKF